MLITEQHLNHWYISASFTPISKLSSSSCLLCNSLSFSVHSSGVQKR